MDDSTAEETRNRKRARLTPSAGDAVDWISGLDDDVLLHVLELLPDARDAVRTGALSRRWLGLWKRVPALSFISRSVWEASDVQERAALTRYVSSVNNVLVLRSQSGCAIERLSISYTTHSPYTDDDPDQYKNGMPAAPSVDPFCNNVASFTDPLDGHFLELLMPASVDAIQGWIWYAFQYGVKSFSVNMRLPYFWSGSGHGDCLQRWGEYKPAVFLDVLNASRPVGLEAMHLALGGARLRLLPTAMEFASLTDLSLEWIKIEASSVHLLARFLSSASCPRLQKLRMRKLCLDAFDQEMLLQADMLLKLRIQEKWPRRRRADCVS